MKSGINHQRTEKNTNSMNITVLLKRLCFLIVLCSSIIRAQLFDDFTDGEFLTNPGWEGDLESFIVNYGKTTIVPYPDTIIEKRNCRNTII